MTLFFLRSIVDFPDHYIVFPTDSAWRRARKLLVEGPTGVRAPPVPLRAKAQSGLKLAHMSTLDFFPSFGGVPFFSLDFRERMPPQVTNEIDFFDCDVECESRVVRLLAGRINTRLEIVNYAASGVGESTSLFLPFKVRMDISESFFIARERHPECQSIYVVSEGFKRFAEGAELKVGYQKASV